MKSVNLHDFYLEFKRKTLLVNLLVYGFLVTVVEIIVAVLTMLCCRFLTVNYWQLSVAHDEFI